MTEKGGGGGGGGRGGERGEIKLSIATPTF